MATTTKTHVDVVASGDYELFAGELARAIRAQWVEGREGDSSIPNGTHQTWTPELITRELIVAVTEFWFLGGKVPTVEEDKTNDIEWRATLDLGWRCDDGDRIVRYLIEER